MAEGLDNKISNILGVKLPQWLLEQLKTRANQNTRDIRDNDNILYLGNKTAWVRVVSSVDLVNNDDLQYFKTKIGSETIRDKSSLARNYILYGGTSKYLNKNSYALRSGIGKDNAYGILGNSEIREFGYRPMPGIMSVSIETQGRLGSVRGASIDFKCWDKDQLDIIDAIYFKLGYTMFLEWGHTYFYPSQAKNVDGVQLDPTKVASTEMFAIDPFEQGLTKEEINVRIARNSRNSEGNYDAMLGMVTNFTFSYNQEGGYDCNLRLMALGVMGDSIKINNAGTLPSLLEEEILKLNKTLAEIDYANRLKEYTDQLRSSGNSGTSTTNDTPKATPPAAPLTVQQYIDKFGKYSTDDKTYYGASSITWPSGKPRNPENADLILNVSPDPSKSTENIFILRRLNGFIPLNDLTISETTVQLESSKIFGILNQIGKDFNNIKQWDVPGAISRAFTFADNETSIFNATWTSTEQNNIETYGLRVAKSSYGKESLAQVPGYVGPPKDDLFLIPISEFVPKLIEVLKNEDTKFTFTEFAASAIFSSNTPKGVKVPSNQPKSFPRVYTIEFTIPFIKNVDVTEIIVTKTQTGAESSTSTDKKGNVQFDVGVRFSFTTTSFIKSFQTPSYVKQGAGFISGPTAATPENTNGAGSTQVPTPTPPAKPDLNAIATQVKQALKYQSSLEIILRTIQIHALNKAINQTGKADLEIGKKTYVLNLVDDKDIVNYKDPNNKNTKKTFLNQVFSSGVFSTFLPELVSGTGISSDTYTTDQKMNPKDLFKIYSKYGFASSLLGNKAPINLLEPVNFKELLKAYVIPYQINQEIIKGTVTNHPVYIPLGLLLMILNHACTIYDTKNTDLQTPLIYVDFNPELNFCLTNGKQLSTDPWTCLIPFEGSFEDYKSLFDQDILIEDGTAIAPAEGSKETVKLFNPETEDLLSGDLPKLKFDEQPAVNQTNKESGNVYRAKMMNILLNIDYLVQIVQQYSQKDGTNAVYLKAFLEQIIEDVNKSLGNFNVLRLAYNDSANTFQIVDDQVIPPLSNESEVTPRDNTSELPLVGKNSIAKSLEIKSEISSKLSNMLAISANSTIPNKATLSTNGDSVGFINTNYVDRYITDRLEVTGSISDKKNNDTLKAAAAQFNGAISDFYSKINPSQTSVGQATNYYIEKISKVKNDEYPTRASFMIPVSVNFTTDGISGMSMGQAFTISDTLLPYTYSTRKTTGFSEARVNNVGFVVIGLTHMIDGNQWTTSVKANMIFLKDKTEFKGDVVKVDARKGAFGTNPANNYEPIAGGTVPGSFGSVGGTFAGKIENKAYSFEELAAIIIGNLEGGYYHPDMFNDGRLKDTPQNKKIFQSSGETMFGFDRKTSGTVATTGVGKQFWELMDAQNARKTWSYNYQPGEPLRTELINLLVQVWKPVFTGLYNANIKDQNLRKIIEADGRLYFNFVYATWNGSGYFQGFSEKIVAAYNAGTTSSEELLKIFINLRLNIRQMPKFTGYADYAVEIIARGGQKIANLTGVQVA